MEHDDEHDQCARLHDALRADSDDAADNQDDGHDGDQRQELDVLLYDIAEQRVDEDAADNRHDDDLDDRHHHSREGDVNPGTREPPSQERRDDRCEDCRRHRHRDGQRNIAARQIRHDVRRCAARAGADEDDACGELWRQAKALGEQPRKARHDRELGQGADEDILRALEDQAEIAQAQRRAHAKHDDAEQQRNVRRRPLERPRLEQSDRSDENDEDRHVLRYEITEFL